MLEEQKNKFTDELSAKTKELRKGKDSEGDLAKRYEQLSRKYETDCLQLKEAGDATHKLNKEKIGELEQQLNEKEETFDMARQQWAKDEAVLKQKLEFAQFQLEEEKKKYQESKASHEAMLKSLHGASRESVVGREEAQQKLNEMECKFIEERKVLDDQAAEARARLMNDFERLKMKENELELQLKLNEGDHEKTVAQLREALAEAEQLRDQYGAKLKSSDTTSMANAAKTEEEFRRREQDLERQLDEKEAELEE